MPHRACNRTLWRVGNIHEASSLRKSDCNAIYNHNSDLVDSISCRIIHEYLILVSAILQLFTRIIYRPTVLYFIVAVNDAWAYDTYVFFQALENFLISPIFHDHMSCRVVSFRFKYLHLTLFWGIYYLFINYYMEILHCTNESLTHCSNYQN